MARAAPGLRVLWPDGRPVGEIVVPGPTYFGYTAEWLADGHNLSPLSVPFSPAAFRQRADGFDQLPGFLSDCLPDRWGRRIMEREFRERDIAPTPMRMLAWVGRRGLGALSFEPALDEEHGQAAWERVTPLLLLREAQAVLRDRPPEAFSHLLAGGTAGGAFPKATVGLMRDGTLLLGGNFAVERPPGVKVGLLKLDIEDDPLAPLTDGRMEAAYLRMARAAGIRVARCQVLADRSTQRMRHHLFVQRFDLGPGRRRLHLLSLAGALHRHALTYEDLLLATRDLTADRTQVLEAVRRMCFNVRAGNADDHGKNHSFLYDAETGRWTLSPAYDLTPSNSRENQRGLFPATFGPSPRRETLARVAAEAGVTEAEFAEIDGEVAASIARWPEHAKLFKLPATLVAKAAAIQRELAGALGSDAPARTRRRRPRW